jgi:hypothetical protein
MKCSVDAAIARRGGRLVRHRVVTIRVTEDRRENRPLSEETGLGVGALIGGCICPVARVTRPCSTRLCESGDACTQAEDGGGSQNNLFHRNFPSFSSELAYSLMLGALYRRRLLCAGDGITGSAPPHDKGKILTMIGDDNPIFNTFDVEGNSGIHRTRRGERAKSWRLAEVRPGMETEMEWGGSNAMRTLA